MELKKGMAPWAILAGALMMVFIVWLFSSMARTEDANRILLTLLLSTVAIGAAMAFAMAGRSGSGHDRR